MDKRSDSPPPKQQGLFGSLEPDPPKAPTVDPHEPTADLRELADALPKTLNMGTSSWSFAGWRGLVYAKTAAQKHLSRHGLAAYSQHPLLTGVGVDRTFYAPIGKEEFAGYAAGVPTSFRFLVKAWGELTTPVLRGQTGPNARYLDPKAAIEEVITPAVEGLGDKLGPLVFQFPPQGSDVTRDPAAFAAMLHAFFSRLPQEVHYAVELRDKALFTKEYVDALADTPARHCFCAHPRMPSIHKQRELAKVDRSLTVRWMLHDGFGYEQAKERYQPFDQLVDADPTTREQIADLCVEALLNGLPTMVVANNKAEGSAPLSITELAKVLATRELTK